MVQVGVSFGGEGQHLTQLPGGHYVAVSYRISPRPSHHVDDSCKCGVTGSTTWREWPFQPRVTSSRCSRRPSQRSVSECQHLMVQWSNKGSENWEKKEEDHNRKNIGLKHRHTFYIFFSSSLVWNKVSEVAVAHAYFWVHRKVKRWFFQFRLVLVHVLQMFLVVCTPFAVRRLTQEKKLRLNKFWYWFV